MRMFRTVAVVAGVLVWGGRSAAAQQVPLEKFFGADLLTGALNPGAAQTEGTGDRMWGAQITFGATAYRVLSVSGDAGLAVLKDRRSFTESTTQGDMTSGVAGGLATLAVGLHTPPLLLAHEKALEVSVGVSVGHTWLSASRSIGRCRDCTVETVGLDGGDFWEPGIQAYRGRGGINVRYRIFRDGGDLQNALMAGFTVRIPVRQALAEPPADPKVPPLKP